MSTEYACAVGPQGNCSGEITERGFVWGAGMVLRKSAWINLLEKGYQPRLVDRQGSILSAGGNTELCYAFILDGWKLWYEETLLLTHFITEKRLDWDYLRKLHRGFEKSDPILKAYLHVINNDNVEFSYYKNSLCQEKMITIMECLSPLEEKYLVIELNLLRAIVIFW